MPQVQLPFFAEGVTHINANLAFVKENDRITYFNGNMPVFVHDSDDHRTFKMITAQFCVTGNTKLVEISRAFGVPEISVKQAVKLYREEGPEGFYKKRKARGPAVLTEAVLCQAQQLFDEGLEVSEVAARIGVKPNTLSKAACAGRVHKRAKNKDAISSSKSMRRAEDSCAPMGMGANNTMDRIAASVGELEAVSPAFQPALDVPNEGESLFLRKLVLGIPAQASSKNLTRLLMPAAPRPPCVRAAPPHHRRLGAGYAALPQMARRDCSDAYFVFPLALVPRTTEKQCGLIATGD